MAQLKNELSWSRTRVATYETCPRLYYYQYYQKWNGWSWDASDASKQAYLFSKMTNLPMLVGHAVHETIRRILVGYRDADGSGPADPTDFARREILTRTWRDAKAEKWKRSLKNHPPVFEIYYGVPESELDLKAVGARASQCVQTFLDSALHAELRDATERKWLAVDEPPSFDESTKHKLDGRTIWALPDFAREIDGGDCEIWDWKTGRPSPHDEMQLRSYALFARDRWGYPAERIRLKGFYLNEGEIKEYSCDASALADIEARIRSDFLRLEELLADVEANVPRDPDEAFPMIEAGATCRSCFFQELCERVAVR
ncbi:MAG: PD-(D/E)XK nuclease family protein [Planctomycetes bacterium]|nr:PD-(D/E)XK nuclease family protein [Planctomycetota bacterium]